MAERVPFCVVCGQPAAEATLRGGECEACYLDKHVLASVPATVDVEVCVHCANRKRGEIWVDDGDVTEAAIAQAAIEAVLIESEVDRPSIRTSQTAQDERNHVVAITVRGSAEGVTFQRDLETKVRLKNATCVRCSRYHGGYYEAVVQVRRAKRPMSKTELAGVRAIAYAYIEKIVGDGDAHAFILKDGDIDTGMDFYMGTTSSGRAMARLLAEELGGRVTDHHKIIGQKDGLDIVRMTFAVRLPNVRVGDILLDGDGVAYAVDLVRGKRARLIATVEGLRRDMPIDATERFVRLDPDDALDAVIVTSHAAEWEVMDPWTYETKTVLRPADDTRQAGNVSVVRYDGELIAVPRRS